MKSLMMPTSRTIFKAGLLETLIKYTATDDIENM